MRDRERDRERRDQDGERQEERRRDGDKDNLTQRLGKTQINRDRQIDKDGHRKPARMQRNRETNRDEKKVGSRRVGKKGRRNRQGKVAFQITRL